MRTYVPMTTSYLISRRGAPHIVIFQARGLDELAAAIAAQPDPEALEIYANAGSFNRALTADERATLHGLTG
jgi:hypothetical protein